MCYISKEAHYFIPLVDDAVRSLLISSHKGIPVISTIPSRLLCCCRNRVARSKADSKRSACSDSLCCARQTCRKGKSHRCNSSLISSITLCIYLRLGVITTKLCSNVINSAAESLDSIGIRNTRQVCVRIVSLYDSRIADYACIQATTTARGRCSCSVCRDTACGIEISIHFYRLVSCVIRELDSVKGDSTLEGSIARYTKFREWSVWLQRHKVGNARSCTSFFPRRLEKGEVCAKILLTDYERRRVSVNLSVHVPPDCTIGKITRAIESDEGGCRSEVSAIVVLIHHLTAPPSCDALLSSVLIYRSVNTTLNVTFGISQSEECCHYKTAINICCLTKCILDVLVACKVGNVLLQVTINLTGDIGVCQTQFVIECAVCGLEVGELRSHC